jgi:uncharacterized membrane protein
MFPMMLMLTLAVLLPVGAMMLFLFGRLFFILDALPTSYLLDGSALIVVILWMVDMTALVLAVSLKVTHEEKPLSKQIDDVEE